MQKLQNLDLIRCPDKNPNWESFSQIEPYLKSDFGSFLWRLVPIQLRWRFFVSSGASPKEIKQYRNKVEEEYNSIIVSVSAEWTNPRQPEKEIAGEDIADYIANLFSKEVYANLLLSRYQISKSTTLIQYRQNIKSNIQKQSYSLEKCEILLEKPHYYYLREEEKNDLLQLRKFLRDSIICGNQCLASINQKLGEIECIRNNRISEWKSELESLRSEAEQYIKLADDPIGNDIIDSVENLIQKIRTAREEYPIHLVSQDSVEKLRRLEENSMKLAQALRDSRWEYGDLYANALNNTAHAVLESNSTQNIEDSGLYGQHPIDNLSLKQLRTEIKQFITSSYAKYISRKRVNKLKENESKLEDVLYDIEKKLDRYDQQLSELSAQAEQYIKFAEFLSDEVLLTEISEFKNEVLDTQKTYAVKLADKSVEKQLQTYTNEADNLAQQLKDSRPQFADLYGLRLRRLSKSILARFEEWHRPNWEIKYEEHGYNNNNLRADEIHNELVTIITGSTKAHLSGQRLGTLACYEAAIEEHIVLVRIQINTWQAELHGLIQQAEPFLSLEEFLSDEAIIREVEDLISEMGSFVEDAPLSVFPQRTLHKLALVNKGVCNLKYELENSRNEYACAEYQSLKLSCLSLCGKFQNGPNSEIQTSAGIDNEDAETKTIDETIFQVQEFLSTQYIDYVDEENITLIKKLQRDLAIEEREVQHKITAVRNNLTRIESAATPYLILERYLESDDLLDQTAALQSKVALIRNQVPVNLLSNEVQDSFEQVESEVPSLFQKLRHSRRKYAEKEFKQSVESGKYALSKSGDRLKPARADGSSIKKPEEIKTQLQQSINQINQTLSGPWETRLKDDEKTELKSLKSTINKHRDFVIKKVEFDKKLNTQRNNYKKLREEALPYLGYKKYLTEPVEAKLNDNIDLLTKELSDIANDTDFELLGDANRSLMEELRYEVKSVKTHLHDYNDEFIHRQRQECKSLFSNIGPSELNLTEQQQKAVIRNGVYNQVIAAAGTGKTLTLTTRVAYLVHKQNISPEKILVVTYTTEATEEMERRLAAHFGITEVEIRTIHSFGYGVLQKARSEYVDVIDSNEISNFIGDIIKEERDSSSSSFLDHYYQFLVHFDDVYYEEEDFETRKQYIKTKAEQDYLTLRDTEVKSRAEKLIADFLYIHRVNYRYEDRATWAESADDKAGYTPDFYLPDHDIYIEHWGVDESGEVAPWFSQSTEEYHKKMDWAREQFEKSDSVLIETYEFEHDQKRLKQVLRDQLEDHDITLEKMDFKELVDEAFEYNKREKWIKEQFEKFILNSKLFEVKPDEIKPNLNQDNPRQYHFGLCGVYLLKKYILHLNRNGLVDFTDMIQDAVSLIQDNPDEYRQEYDHLLVDEFQDVGKGKLDLIRELTDKNGPKLFAVGDDWQSIFSFQGAVIDYFTNFSEYFGEPVRTDLTTNFRSPNQIIAAGVTLIDNNSNQLDKTVQPTVNKQSNPRVHPIRGERFYDYVRRVGQYTVDLIREYCAAGSDPADIMVLCRFDNAVPYLDEIKDGLKSQKIPYFGKSDEYRGPSSKSDDGVTVYSLYQAKGLEAKHVILVHAAEGPFGFPPENRDNELLQPVQPASMGGTEEERRAFYVSITRTKQTLDILTRSNKESRFLEEIEEYTVEVDTGKVQPLDDVGEFMTVTAQIDKLLGPWNKQHQRGILKDKQGGSARFVSWESTDPPTLDQGEWYKLINVKVGQYKGEKELILTDDCSVRCLNGEPRITKSSIYED